MRKSDAIEARVVRHGTVPAGDSRVLAGLRVGHMVGHGHGAEAVFIGVLCIAVLLFFLGVGIWQRQVWLPRRAKQLVGEMRKDRMEKRI